MGGRLRPTIRLNGLLAADKPGAPACTPVTTIFFVSKSRDKFQPSADGRKISLQSGNLAIVETLPAIEPGDVRLVHLRHAGDINLRLSCRLAESWQRYNEPRVGRASLDREPKQARLEFQSFAWLRGS